MRKRTKPAIPLVGINKLIEIIKTLPDESFTYDEVASRVGIKPTSLRNMLTTAYMLGFVKDTETGFTKLTQEGQEFKRALISGNIEEASRIVREAGKGSELMRVAWAILKSMPDITPIELGEKIREKFAYEWRDKQTVRRVGTVLMGIVNFAKTARIVDTKPVKAKFVMPNCWSNVAFEFMQNIPEGEISLDEMCMRLGMTPKKISSLTAFLKHMHLIVQPSLGKIAPTPEGIEFIRAKDEDTRARIFRNALLNSIYGEFIRSLDGKEINTSYLAEEFAKLRGGKGKKATFKGYAQKFLDWLKKAKLVSKHGKSYIVHVTEEREVKPTPEVEAPPAPKKVTIPGEAMDYFQLGKFIGHIEHASGKSLSQEEITHVLEIANKLFGKQTIEISELAKLELESFKKKPDPLIFIGYAKLLEKNLTR